MKVAYNQRWGVANGNSRLTPNDVTAIRQQLTDGIPTRWIARRFGICQSTVMQIKKGETWTNNLTH